MSDAVLDQMFGRFLFLSAFSIFAKSFLHSASPCAPDWLWRWLDAAARWLSRLAALFLVYRGFTVVFQHIPMGPAFRGVAIFASTWQTVELIKCVHAGRQKRFISLTDQPYSAPTYVGRIQAPCR